MRQVKMSFGKVVIHAELLETPTADAVWAALPLESRVATWGEEVYFLVPLSMETEPDARDVVEAGEIAFRPVGGAVIIGFGATPVSHGDEIRLAAPANVFARTTDDVHALKQVEPGTLVVVEAVVQG